MRINLEKITAPKQSGYSFCDGELDSDPIAISHYFGNDKALNKGSRKRGMYDRQYEKARRQERMAKRAAKARQRNDY